MFFKKKGVAVSVDVMNINAMHVSTGQMGAYIKKLYDEEGFRHLGYRFEKQKGLSRCVIYTLPNKIDIIQYFKDRCPAMVEEACRKLEGEAHEWTKWENGFEEIKM